jgi:hypothetical protein
VCRESGKRADGFRCPDVYEEYFLESTPLDAICPIHGKASFLERVGHGFKEIFN